MTTTLIDPTVEPVFHIAFYRFAMLPDPDAVVLRLRELTSALLGSILVATEGINGMLAGRPDALDRFERALVGDAAFGGAFVGTAFKRSPCQTLPFRRIKVRRKREIVTTGTPELTGPTHAPTTHVSPQQWRELIGRDDVVLLDNRNHFEFRLGRFKGAIDPGVVQFRDFPAYVQAHADEWKAAGKTVAMYCTGGIRCEKTAPWMQSLGLDVRQLDGGILNYFQTLPDAQQTWEGECFVFDNRVALDTHLQETGTTLADVHGDEPAEAWRLARGQRLDEPS